MAHRSPRLLHDPSNSEKFWYNYFTLVANIASKKNKSKTEYLPFSFCLMELFVCPYRAQSSGHNSLVNWSSLHNLLKSSSSYPQMIREPRNELAHQILTSDNFEEC